MYQYGTTIFVSDGEGKLAFYSTIKHSISGMESYLDILKNFKHRQALTKLQISAHSLQVEVGRYARPKIPRNERFCKLCSSVSVENDLHNFLTKYDVFIRERFALYEEIKNSCKNFTEQNDIEKCTFMLSADNIANVSNMDNHENGTIKLHVHHTKTHADHQ